MQEELTEEGVQDDELPEKEEAAGMTEGVTGQQEGKPRVGSDPKARVSCQECR